MMANSSSLMKLQYPHHYKTKFDLFWNKTPRKFSRAGVFPYFIENEKVYFVLSVDALTDELSDFGGKVARFENDWKITASRELKEESCNVFGISSKKLDSSIFTHDGFNVYGFLELEGFSNEKFHSVSSHFENVLNELKKSKARSQLLETSRLCVVEHSEMVGALQQSTSKVWQYIKHFFSNGDNWPNEENFIKKDLSKKESKCTIAKDIKNVYIFRPEMCAW